MLSNVAYLLRTREKIDSNWCVRTTVWCWTLLFVSENDVNKSTADKKETSQALNADSTQLVNGNAASVNSTSAKGPRPYTGRRKPMGEKGYHANRNDKPRFDKNKPRTERNYSNPVVVSTTNEPVPSES